MSPIMKHAQADTTDNVRDHIPEAPHSADFSSPSDNIGNLRFAVFPTVHVQKLSVRVLQATIFRRLEPITNLQSGEEFMKIWFQCVRNHYARWERGVGHTDPSVANLMMNTFDKSKGVLNDWDLAIIRVPNNENLPHSERTGMPPFMAIDLLSKAYYDGHMKRLYRHGLEAFIWILPWVFLQYENGRRKTHVLRGWENADYRAVREEKSSFLIALSEVNIMEQFRNEWPIARRLLNWVKSEHNRRDEVEDLRSQRGELDVGNRVTWEAPAGTDKLAEYIRQKRSAPKVAEPKEEIPEEKEPAQVYEEFWKIIIDVVEARPKLDYVYEYLPRDLF